MVDHLADPLLALIQGDVSQRLAGAALQLFSDSGFHGTTTRIISLRAGVSAGALYNSFSSKEEILFILARLAHQESYNDAERARGLALPTPDARIRAIVAALSGFHAHHYMLARVSQYELGTLTGGWKAEVQDLRQQTEFLVRYEIQAGLEAGLFTVEDPRAAMRALLSLCIDVARWFGAARNVTPEEVSEDNSVFALRLLGVSGL